MEAMAVAEGENYQTALDLSPGLPYLSWSRLRTYSDCPTKYRLRYVERIPSEPAGAMLAGRIGHEVIEFSERAEIWRDTLQGPEILGRRFAEAFTQACLEAGRPLDLDPVAYEVARFEGIRWGGRKSGLAPDGEEFRWWIHQGPLMLRRYITVRQGFDEQGLRTKFTKDGAVDGIEVEIRTQIGGLDVVAYIDAVLMADEDGQAAIADWKFGSWSDPYQLAVYAEFIERARGLHIDRGFMIHLRPNECEKWVKVYALDPWRPLIEEDFAELAQGIRAGYFPKKRSSFCRSCDVRESCSWGRTLE